MARRHGGQCSQLDAGGRARNVAGPIQCRLQHARWVHGPGGISAAFDISSFRAEILRRIVADRLVGRRAHGHNSLQAGPRHSYRRPRTPGLGLFRVLAEVRLRRDREAPGTRSRARPSDPCRAPRSGKRATSTNSSTRSLALSRSDGHRSRWTTQTSVLGSTTCASSSRMLLAIAPSSISRSSYEIVPDPDIVPRRASADACVQRHGSARSAQLRITGARQSVDCRRMALSASPDVCSTPTRTLSRAGPRQGRDTPLPSRSPA